jgi:ubiquinone/menaquinone biosynthesis C-methylase UbiE
MNNFDSVARYYDLLARIVFGNSIVKSQVHFLDLIKPSSNVLILGGGTGWILDELKRKGKTINVWYIEMSDEMISRARKKNDSSLNVHFIHGSESDIPHDVLFDVVITNFFLDLFKHDKLKNVIDTIHFSLKPDGIWFVSDFVNGKWWHKILLWIMYRFFKLTASINASELPQWEKLMTLTGCEMYSHSFFNRFIKSSVYRKKPIHFE